MVVGYLGVLDIILVNIQKKITRLMTFKSYFDHTEPIS